MQTRMRRCPALVPAVFLTVLIGLLDIFCWSTISSPIEAAEAVETVEPSRHKTEHKTAIDTSFRLVDEIGRTLTELSVDPSIDPPQIGLNPQAIVTEQNILLLFFQQSSATRHLWLLFSVVSLGLLILLTLFACLPRGPRGPRGSRGSRGFWTAGIFFPGCALIFVFFAYGHWTQLASLQHQQHILERILQHAAHQPSAPEFLIQLGTTIHVASVEMQTTIHVCLDILVLAAIFLLRLVWKQRAARSVLRSEKHT